MKKLALFLITILLSSVAVYTFGENRGLIHEGSVRSFSSCDGGKREETSNGVQVRLEICGGDRDGYDIDASNPDTGEKWDCTYKFTLTGKNKENNESIDIFREKTVTVSSTAKGWFNAFGESGLKAKDLNISIFSVSCSK